MVKSKKLISIVLALALMLTSVFVGGISVSANLDNLYSTTNDYDNLPEGVEFNTVEYSSAPATNVVINGSPEMEDSTNIRHFSAWGTSVETLPAELGEGKALRFTQAKSNDRYNIWQAIARIYKSDSSTIAHFRPTAGKTYEVKLKYYVAQIPNKEIQLQIRQARYSQASFQNDNCNDPYWMEPPVLASITTTTAGWVEASVYFTAPESPQYINLCLTSGTTSEASNVDVWVDDLVVSECVKLTAHNYTPDTDKSVPVSKYTTIGDFKPADIEGYRFGGVFADEAYENRIPAENLAGNYTDVYYKWLPITANDGYCGFEDYTQVIPGTAYNSAVSELSAEAYVGKLAMKNTLAAKGIVAFEIKNANTFNIVGGKTYTVSFAYKTDADAEIYAGVGLLGDVPATAKALGGIEATAGEWKTATLNITPEKGTNENFVLAMLVYSEAGATVYIDDILVSGFEQGYVNPTLNTGFSSDWHPTLALFEGVELPKIWGGQSDLRQPKDTDNDGVYEIENGAELAYAISNGGGADVKYILTKDIYLNNLSAINWKTGEVLVEGYVPNTWFNQNANSFQGSIDGNGHTVYGMYRKDNPSSMSSVGSWGTGLIPKIEQDAIVSIKNLAVDYAFINVECAASAFIATTNGACKPTITIDGCYAGENVQLNGGDAGVFVGYTGGDGGNITIKNSYSLATTSGTVDHGLVAYARQATVTVLNSYNANGPITSYDNSNWTGKYTFTNSYQTEDLGFHNYFYKTNFVTLESSSLMKGLDVFESGKMEFLNTSNVYIATEGFPKLALFEGIELPTIWGGKNETSAPNDSNGDGVYEIENGAELAYIISNGGGTEMKYILTKDIYLNDISKIDWSTGEAASGYTPNSWYYNIPFAGTIDGDGHTVYGLYYNDTSALSWAIQGAGLVPRVDFGTTCEIKNLGIENAYVYGHAGASAFVGCGGTDNSYAEIRAEIYIDRCFAGKNVTVIGTDAGIFRGASRSANTTITNSYSLGSATGSYYGLVAGEAWESNVVITNCFNANGPFGSASGGTFTNSYQTEAGANASGLIDADNMKGLDVFTNASKMPDLNTDNAFTATEDFPLVSVFVKETASDEEDKEESETEIEFWDGTIAEVFANGDGTKENPYEITNGKELALAITTGGLVKVDDVYTEEANFNKYYIITKDIYLNDISKINWITGSVSAGYTAKPWLKHENFAGNIDGNGHTVYGLYYKDTASSYTSYPWGMGLVPYVIEGNTVTISNLGIDNCFINYECGSAAFIGTLNGSSKADINTCFVGNSVTLKGADAGAFRGYAQGGATTITNSYSLATTIGNKNSNGLVGIMYGPVTVSYCYNANGIIPAGNSVTATACYQSSGTDSTGIVTVSAENMKGDDVLTNKDKMPLLNLASAYVPASLDFADHDYYIYLPTGTLLAEDFEPTFLDSFLVSVDAAKVLDGNILTKGVYARFAKEPKANKILVPSALESFIHQGSYETVSSDSVHEKYYGIDTEVVSKKLSEQSEDALNYIFITDIHFMNYDLSWDKQGNVLIEQARLITEWANNDASIDFVVIGGDSVQGFWDTKEGWKSAITNIMEPFTACEKPVLVLMGNHDDNAYATWNVNYSEKIISDLDWKNYVLDPVSPANIVRPADDPNAKHYYYDFTKNGKTTRLFFLDSIDYYQEYDENGTVNALKIKNGYTEESAEDCYKYYNGRSYLGYSEAQVKWLADSLAETDKFDNVLMFSHMGTDAATSPTEFGAEVAAVMAAYNNKTAYKNDALGIDVSYNDEGKILSYQFGHIHREVNVYNAAADLWQIGSSTARADQAQKELNRTLGNAYEACFDVMSVSESAIRKFNIGAGEDGFYVSDADAYGDVNLNGTIDIADLVALAKSEEGKSAAADVNRDNLVGYAADAAALRKRIIDAE